MSLGSRFRVDAAPTTYVSSIIDHRIVLICGGSSDDATFLCASETQTTLGVYNFTASELIFAISGMGCTPLAHLSSIHAVPAGAKHRPTQVRGW